jgi:hypothetical protein
LFLPAKVPVVTLVQVKSDPFTPVPLETLPIWLAEQSRPTLAFAAGTTAAFAVTALDAISAMVVTTTPTRVIFFNIE